MQLFEVKNDIAKIIYNPAENHLLPSDFLLIQDVNQKLIAQIINISTTKSTYDNLADVRLVLSIDKDDNLSYYNGYIPSKSCSIVYIGTDEIIELIKGQNKTILLGNLSNHSECIVTPAIDFVKDKVYIQSDRDDSTKIVVQNIVAELISSNEKVVVLDFDGCYNSITNVKKLKITEDIKLPLDIDAFNTIFDYDIIDCPIEDKAVVQSIILELKEYLKTLDNQFLPFNLFKNVIEQEFASNPISGLMLLRNKLWTYAQANLFAENKAELNLINTALENDDLLIIDASEIEEVWYKFVIQTIKNTIKKDCYFVLSLNDALMDKKAILNLYNRQNVTPIVYTNYNSKYRQILKSICKNQILFKPSKLIENDEPYSVLLNKINSAEFIIYGETTLYLPLIIELQSYNLPSKTEQSIENVSQNIEEQKSSIDSILQEKVEEKKNSDINNTPVNVIPRPMSMQDDYISPDFDVKNKEEIIEDDFNDADLDFLDEQTIEPLMVEDSKDDIIIDKNENDYDYDIFTPLEVPQDNIQTEESSIDVIDSILDETQAITELEADDETVETLSPNEQEVDIDKILELDEDEEITNLKEENLTSELKEKINPDIDNGELNSIEELHEEMIEEHVEENVEEEEIIPIDDVINDITSKLENSENEEEQAASSDNNFEVELESDDDIVPPPVNENIKTKETQTLPVYPVEEGNENTENNIPFQIGDRVYHPKHGYGVIEGFANYSNKILFCQIEFEKVGRRILDPRIAGIEKVS